ncbi:unnamed protein product [Candida verbasci]|uniref:WD40 repeat-like protein n=1 Tax=Candida verbasci TaxID=1227364 RepID=A0A9W4TTM4_9ASCO|nr:unnamed protein product [Candida verbasci]
MDWYNNNSNNISRNSSQSNLRSKKNSTVPNYGPFNYPIMSAAGSSSSSSSNTINVNNGLPLHQSNLPINSPYNNQQKPQFPKSLSPIISNSSQTSPSMTPSNSGNFQIPIERTSYYYSLNPLFASDWVYLQNQQMDYIALGSYKEAFTNKLEIVHGINYENEKLDQFNNMIDVQVSGGSVGSDNTIQPYDEDDNANGFFFQKVCETNLDYPITNLQWDPSMINYGHGERLAASSEVLRLYKINDQGNDNYNLQQTHILANNTASNSTTSTTNSSSNLLSEDINTYPPVTSFDWNKLDSNILITSSVDTTCTVWDLHRSHPRDEMTDTATVKTQLIAHDSEVFDVKFLHKSTNIFASVGNDGSMRVFDLRSLEHSTIIYEPTPPTSTTSSNQNLSTTFNSKALLTLSTSNIDQHHLATVGINSNQIIIIDMRMPGLPVAIIDGSLNGMNNAAINSIKYHPTSNYLVSGGDDCQSLVWDLTNLSKGNDKNQSGFVIDTPVLAYEEDLEINNVCWRQNQGDYMGIVSGKGFQAVSIYDI